MGEVLGNKQLVYEEQMKNICDEMGIDNDMISQGLADKEGEFKEKKDVRLLIVYAEEFVANN